MTERVRAVFYAGQITKNVRLKIESSGLAFVGAARPSVVGSGPLNSEPAGLHLHKDSLAGAFDAVSGILEPSWIPSGRLVTDAKKVCDLQTNEQNRVERVYSNGASADFKS